MKQRIMNNVGALVALSVLLTFLAASFVMYDKYSSYMRQDVKNEAEYLAHALDNTKGEVFIRGIGDMITSRLTLIEEDGKVVFDSRTEAGDMENHGDRPEVQQALKEGKGETVRFSQTFSQQTFYYALGLEDGRVLRVAKTTDSVFKTMFSSFTLLGLILAAILILGFFLVERQTEKLIEPINLLNLEKPLERVEYEELRPLLNRVDQQNRQIASQVRELKQAESVRREFSANVSHELKTPLMSISGYAEIMKNGLVQPGDVPEFAGRIYDEASRLTTLVQDIIELSKLDEKSGEMPLEPVDLYELLQDVCRNLNMPAQKRGVTITCEGSSLRIPGVRHVLYEMFYNLADNAVKYNKEGGWVKLTLSSKGNKACFCVEDNGIGIAAEEQERIFERFYRVDKSHSRQTGGTGLGLSIVKHGAALHQAQIYLESQPGQGTKIEVVFHRTEVEEDERKRAQEL